MNHLHLYKRLTRRYVDEWRHLDDEQYVGRVKVLAGRQVREARDYDDGGSWRYRVVAPAALGSADLTGAIEDTLSHHGCSHEYDCCGCRSVRAQARRVSRREYVVTLHTSFNY